MLVKMGFITLWEWMKYKASMEGLDARLFLCEGIIQIKNMYRSCLPHGLVHSLESLSMKGLHGSIMNLLHTSFV